MCLGKQHTPGVSLLPACFIDPSLNKSYLIVSLYCGHMHLGSQTVQGLSSLWVLYPCGDIVSWLMGWVESHVWQQPPPQIMPLTLCPLLGLNNWKQQKLQTWIFQLIGRCPNQSKAEMEKQMIVGYIKQGYLQKRKGSFDAFIKGSGKISSWMFCNTVVMQT